MIDVNVKGTFYCAQAALARMPDDGAVVTVSSIGGRQPSPVTGVPYAASKADVLGLTRRLAREVGGRGQRVNAVAPGPFPSKMMAATLDAFGEAIAASAPLGRIGRADDMAGVAVFLASRAGSYLTGTVIPVDGGIATTA